VAWGFADSVERPWLSRHWGNEFRRSAGQPWALECSFNTARIQAGFISDWDSTACDVPRLGQAMLPASHPASPRLCSLCTLYVLPGPGGGTAPRGMALRTAAQPASPAGKRPPPPKPLGFKALAPGERCGSPCPRLVHDPLHRRLEHAQATAQVALADHTLDDPWAGKEPKSRPLALPVGKQGRRPVAVNPWARATRQPQRSVQARQASRGQG